MSNTEINERIPLYKDLVKKYKDGTLQKPINNILCYHLTQERKELGLSYVFHDHWENFINEIKFNQDLNDKKIEIL